MRRLCFVLLPGLAVLACLWGLVTLFMRTSSVPLENPGAPAAAIVAGTATSGAAGGQRRPLPSSGDPTKAATPATVTFDGIVDELVALGGIVVGAIESGTGSVEASRADDRAEQLLRDLRQRFPAPEALALDRLTRLRGGPGDRETLVRRGVLLRILRDGLVALHERCSFGGSRRPLDAVVSSVLATLPFDPTLAEALTNLLTDAPYLSEAHEAAVLDLAEQAGVERFLQPLATALLRTLWHNLRTSGARTESDIAAFALLLQEDLNASRRLAALQELLVANGGRYRDLVVERVRDSGDEALARELGQVAAQELASDDAIDTLAILQPVAGDGLLGAFLAVGERDGGALERRYQQCLTDGARPELRAALVSGAMTADGALGLALAQSAFDHDPDRRVRARALYALAAHPDPAVAEAALTRALDDPRTANDAEWLIEVAGALRNLAAGAGGVDALREIGRRLLGHPRLSEAGRRRVRTLLAEHLPQAPR